MAIPTYNTQQTDGNSNSGLPRYVPYNPFANQNKQTVQQRYPAYWRNSSGTTPPVQQSLSPFGEQTRRIGNTSLPLPAALVQQRQTLRPTLQQSQDAWQAAARMQAGLRPTALQSQQAQRAAAQMQVNIRQQQFLNDLRAGKYASPYEEWQASGGVNRQLTDWFDPYDPAGSPYMTSQYIPQTNYDGYGGYGYGGGWGGGGSYEQQDTAPFYQGNYTQRRNSWNETLLTWGLRQQ